MTSLTGFKTQDFRLDGNTTIRLRAVAPADRESFASEFEALSEEARYCRCFAYRKSLKESELDMLCNVDGVNHVAVVALQLNNDGFEKQGIGGARFIRHLLPSNTKARGLLSQVAKATGCSICFDEDGALLRGVNRYQRIVHGSVENFSIHERSLQRY